MDHLDKDKDINLVLSFFKPDAIANGHVGTIISRLSNAGFEPVDMKYIQFHSDKIDEHYYHVSKRDFYPEMKDFFLDKEILIMLLRYDPFLRPSLNGISICSHLKLEIGLTRNAPLGTIRGDLGSTGFKNLIHSSDNIASSKKEIKCFYTIGELIDLSPRLTSKEIEWLKEV